MTMDETKKRRCYISGPMAGLDIEERKKTFRAAEEELRERGFIPVNPFRNGVPDAAPREMHMRAALALLAGCDCICMLEGWRKSPGAKWEYDSASICGLEIIELSWKQ